MHRPVADSPLEAITGFLASIGIAVEARPIVEPTLLPGVTIDRGAVVYDPARLAWPGDLLHEAGHIAVLPPELRHRLSGTIPPEAHEAHAGEPEVTAWAFAATMAIGLPPQVLFHPGGYRGQSESLAFTYANGCYPGVAGLVAAGLAASPRECLATGEPAYPAMRRWLRE